MPTDTSPTIRPSGAYIGALPLADLPVAPLSMPTWALPSTVTIGSATVLPIRAGTGCECRTRFMSMTTT